MLSHLRKKSSRNLLLHSLPAFFAIMMRVRQLAAIYQQRRFSQKAQISPFPQIFTLPHAIFGHDNSYLHTEIIIFSEPIAGSIPDFCVTKIISPIDNYFRFPLHDARHILDS
jgi:hypothetical protein